MIDREDYATENQIEEAILKAVRDEWLSPEGILASISEDEPDFNVMVGTFAHVLGELTAENQLEAMTILHGDKNAVGYIYVYRKPQENK